jgi:hypothetical protein
MRKDLISQDLRPAGPWLLSRMHYVIEKGHNISKRFKMLPLVRCPCTYIHRMRELVGPQGPSSTTTEAPLLVPSSASAATTPSASTASGKRKRRVPVQNVESHVLSNEEGRHEEGGVLKSSAKKKKKVDGPLSSSSSSSPSIPSTSSYSCADASELGDIFVNQWLDCKDSKEKWVPAQVLAHVRGSREQMTRLAVGKFLQLDGGNRGEDVKAIKVHFKGYKSKYDEWLLVLPDRVRKLYTHTPRAAQTDPVTAFRVGAVLDVCDQHDDWLAAVILSLAEDRKQVLVHYRSYSNEYDEWIDMHSPRIAQRGTFVAQSCPSLPNDRASMSSSSARAPTFASSVRPKLSYHGINSTLKSTKSSAVNARQVLPHSKSSRTRDETKELVSRREKEFLTMLRERYKLRVCYEERDGNCLFRSISRQLYGNPDVHALIRTKCMLFVAKNKTFFSQFVTEPISAYVRRLRRVGEWGDNVEIQALAEMYGRPVEIYSQRRMLEGPLVFQPETMCEPNATPLRLRYYNLLHYDTALDLDREQDIGLTRLEPGVIENLAIRNGAHLDSARARDISSAMANVQWKSDVEFTEKLQFDHAVELSNSASSSDFAKARHINDLQTTERSMIEQALAMSMDHYTHSNV